MRRGITWLASFPKSGNTWVRAFIDIAAAGSLRASVTEIELPDYRPLRSDDLQSTVYHLRLIHGRLTTHRRLASEGRHFLKTHLPLRTRDGHAVIEASTIRKAVYLVRDPRDVAISYAAHCSINIDRAIAMMADVGHIGIQDAQNIAEYRGTWSDHVSSWTAPGDRRVLWVRYEDLLAEPSVAFPKIAKHLSLHPRFISAAITATHFEAMQRREVAGLFTDKPAGMDRFFRAGTAGQWRHELTRRQRALIEANHRETMKRFGYL